jgi:hypothetical protein
LMFAAVVLGILSSTQVTAKADQIGLDFTGGSSYFASQDSGSPYTIGWSFTTSETLSVSGLGFWDDQDHTLGFSHDVGLWDSSQNLLASTTITSTSMPVASTGPGQWLFNTIGTITLTPGTYLIGADYVKADDVDAYRYYVSNITTVDGLTFDSARYVYGSGLNFPGGYQGGPSPSYFGPNLEFGSPVPEPTSLLMGVVSLGVISGALLLKQRIRRKNRS